jgi:hypothetical protein
VQEDQRGDLLEGGDGQRLADLAGVGGDERDHGSGAADRRTDRQRQPSAADLHRRCPYRRQAARSRTHVEAIRRAVARGVNPL